MPDLSVLFAYIEKGGVVALLLINIGVLYKFGIAVVKQVLGGDWVPGRYYKDLVLDRDRLRAENDAYRSVTLRAVGVAERVASKEV